MCVTVQGFDFSGVYYLGQITGLKMIGKKEVGLSLTYCERLSVSA